MGGGRARIGPSIAPTCTKPMALPTPSPEALAHSQALTQTLQQQIQDAGGFISFAEYMAGALYSPGLGYYTAGARKFGAAGDFVTAPEMSPLFGQTLAPQLAQIMAASAPQILEVGAGSGRLAADLLQALEKLDCLPDHYFILDVSADLRERQFDTLASSCPKLLPRVQWLDQLPPSFSGAIVANELLDALPVNLVQYSANGPQEKGVILNPEGEFAWSYRPATDRLLARADEIFAQHPVAPGYETEIGLATEAWAASWGSILTQGALLLIDYGFPRQEYYHPQRTGGTVMCHYRHHAHPDPFYLPGLQDITAHVDFTAVISAAHAAGLELLGFTSQARFLLNCGLLDNLGQLPVGSPDYIRATHAVDKLTSPAEMGELFKVIAIGRGLAEPLLGFLRGDRSHTL